MDHLWAPWRIDYVAGEKPEGCILCQKLQQETDENNYILYRGEHSFIILNTFPYNSGHLMVVPHNHVGRLVDLSPAQIAEMMQLTQVCIQVLREALSADGINLGMNIGAAAGAGIDDHVHMHIVPRWQGDTNYMTVMAQTRVVPQSLTETAQQLRPLIVQAAQEYRHNLTSPQHPGKGH